MELKIRNHEINIGQVRNKFIKPFTSLIQKYFILEHGIEHPLKYWSEPGPPWLILYKDLLKIRFDSYEEYDDDPEYDPW